MTDLRKSMKYSLIFGLIGALLIPFLYECYANVSATVAMVVVALWTVFAGIMFSKMSFKEATVGITACLAYTGVLGLVVYLIIHPIMVNFLNEVSIYFPLPIKDQMMYVVYAAIIMLCMYLVCYSCYGLKKAFNHLKLQHKKTGEYIKDAFSDDNDEKNK